MSPRVAVVGHVEWGDFAVVDHVPTPGEIEHADATFAVVAGGGSVAAVQLAKLAGAADVLHRAWATTSTGAARSTS